MGGQAPCDTYNGKLFQFQIISSLLCISRQWFNFNKYRTLHWSKESELEAWIPSPPEHCRPYVLLFCPYLAHGSTYIYPAGSNWMVILDAGAAHLLFAARLVQIPLYLISLQCYHYTGNIHTLCQHSGNTTDHTTYPHWIRAGSANSYNVMNSQVNIVNVDKVIAGRRPEIMHCPRPPDPRRRHEDVSTDRLYGVRNCILETTSFGGGGVRKVGQIRGFYFNPGIRERGRHVQGKSLVRLEHVGIIAD